MAFTTNDYGQLATGLKTMMANGNEAEAKRTYAQKLQQYGAGFDKNAFAAATKNMGFGGANGFTVDQINQWAGNPTIQSDYKDLATGLQGMIGSGNEGQAKSIYNQKVAQFGSNFDHNAFQNATANLGMGGPNGFSQQQISEWAANPQTQQTIADNKFNATTSAANPTFTGNGGSANPVMADYVKNPYLDDMAKGITDQMNENWTRNQLPSIRSGAMAAGGFGGSRQGVVEANGLNDMNRSLGQNLTNLYGQDYTQDRQRALQKYSADQGYNLGMANNNLGYGNLALGNKQANNSYDLGLRSNDLGFGQLDASINQNNFNNQLAGANFGLNVYDRVNGYNQQGTNNGTTTQNTPINYFNTANSNTMAAAGTGGSIVAPPQGSPISAGLGAGLATYGMLNGQQTNPSTNGYTNNWYKP